MVMVTGLVAPGPQPDGGLEPSGADLAIGPPSRLALTDVEARPGVRDGTSPGRFSARVHLPPPGTELAAGEEPAAGQEPAGAGAARLESLAALLRACPGVYLEICGPGPEAEAVRELLQRAGRLPATQLGICADVPAGDQALGPPGVGLTLRSAP